MILHFVLHYMDFNIFILYFMIGTEYGTATCVLAVNGVDV